MFFFMNCQHIRNTGSTITISTTTPSACSFLATDELLFGETGVPWWGYVLMVLLELQ
jgi:hypothetical protein